MKKLYVLVFLIINFNQIWCSISINYLSPVSNKPLYIDLSIQNTNKSQILGKINLELPKTMVDEVVAQNKHHFYRFKKGERTKLEAIIQREKTKLLDFTKIFSSFEEIGRFEVSLELKDLKGNLWDTVARVFATKFGLK